MKTALLFDISIITNEWGNGAAVEWLAGFKEWCVNHNRITEPEHRRTNVLLIQLSNGLCQRAYYY